MEKAMNHKFGDRVSVSHILLRMGTAGGHAWEPTPQAGLEGVIAGVRTIGNHDVAYVVTCDGRGKTVLVLPKHLTAADMEDVDDVRRYYDHRSVRRRAKAGSARVRVGETGVALVWAPARIHLSAQPGG
jgi:hypothetical protein